LLRRVLGLGLILLLSSSPGCAGKKTEIPIAPTQQTTPDSFTTTPASTTSSGSAAVQPPNPISISVAQPATVYPLIYPAQDEKLSKDKPLSITWKPAAGATGYELEITASNGNSARYSAGKATSYSLAPEKVPSGDFTLRVSTNLKDGKHWSPTLKLFSAQADNYKLYLTSPLPIPTGPYPVQDMTLIWDAASDIGYYWLQVKDSNDSKNTPLVDAWVKSAHSYTIPSTVLREGHTYEVKILGTNTPDKNDPNYVEFHPDNSGSKVWDWLFEIR